jgi:hypothetical protein
MEKEEDASVKEEDSDDLFGDDDEKDGESGAGEEQGEDEEAPRRNTAPRCLVWLPHGHGSATRGRGNKTYSRPFSRCGITAQMRSPCTTRLQGSSSWQGSGGGKSRR